LVVVEPIDVPVIELLLQFASVVNPLERLIVRPLMLIGLPPPCCWRSPESEVAELTNVGFGVAAKLPICVFTVESVNVVVAVPEFGPVAVAT
jgi:hypothetical protein